MKYSALTFLSLFLLMSAESRAQLECYGAISPSSTLWNNVDSVYGCDGVTYPNDTTANFQHNIAHYTFDPASGNLNGCHADFTFDPLHNLYIDSSITLGTPLYLWEFESGQTSTFSNPVHTATTTGNEHICLTLTDGACVSKTCRRTLVQTAGTQYGCSIYFNYLTTGLFASFTIPGPNLNGYNYYWTFGDGDTLTGVMNPNHLYAADGVYYVRFHYENSSGNCNNNTQYLINVSSTTSSASPLYTYITQSIPNCNNNGTLTATPYGGIPPITYLWSNGQTTQTANNLGAGNYTVTLTDDSGHIATGSSYLYSSCHNVIEGTAYNDVNGNCIQDAGEFPLAGIYVEAYDSNGTSGCSVTDSSGHYSIDIYGTGTFQLSAFTLFGGWGNCGTAIPCNAASIIFAILGDTSFGNIIGFNSTGGYDLFAEPFCSPANPGFDKEYVIWAGDYSVVPYSDTATVIFTYDTALVYLYSLIPIPVNDSINHTLTWQLSNLGYNAQALHSFFHVPVSVSSNYLLQSDFNITPTLNDCDTTNNHLYFSQPVINAWDPNGKEVTPEGSITDEDSVLTYTIHFQNTGTDTTHFVIVRDTLSSYLNPASVVTLAASVPYSNFNISGTGILEWVFNPLFLPDSASNSVASKGFVMFKIKVKPNLSTGTVINNSASIYFDYNAPVVTNTVINTFITGIKDWANNNLQFSVYPNPVESELTVKSMQSTITEIEITDLTGRKIYSEEPNQQSVICNLKSFASGIYFLKAKLEDGSEVVRKFVKM